MGLIRDLEPGQTGYVRAIDFLRDFEGGIHLTSKTPLRAIPPIQSSYQWYFVQRSYEIETRKPPVLFANTIPDVTSLVLRDRTARSMSVLLFDELHPNEQKEIMYMNLHTQILKLNQAIDRAVRREHFLKAAWLKKVRDSTNEDLEELCFGDNSLII